MQQYRKKILYWITKLPSIFYIVVFLIITFSILSRHFATLENLFNVIRQSSVLMIVSLGMLVAIMSGGIDLSVGVIVGLAGTIIAVLLRTGLNLSLVIAISILACLLIGTLSGLLISKGRIQPAIVTFGMFFTIQGINQGITKGGSITISNKFFEHFGNSLYLGVPSFLWVVVSMIIVSAILLRRTTFGSYVCAIGNDIEGARSQGISVGLYLVLVYIFSALMAGVSGVILASRLITGNALIGIGIEFESLAAVVVGGTLIGGGSGTLAGTIFGALVISILKNGLSLLGLRSEVTSAIVGITIISSVVIAQVLYSRRKLSEQS